MNEEIDIIELLKRVKEGKEPHRIKICDNEYYRPDNFNANTRTTLNDLYRNCSNDCCWVFDERINFNTTIKILDKPIIEELKPVKYGNVVTIPDRDILMNKINEIIKWINNKE